MNNSHSCDCGLALRKAQVFRNIKSVDIASHFSVFPQHVSAWRSCKNMKINLVIELCRFLDMSIDEFIELGRNES